MEALVFATRRSPRVVVVDALLRSERRGGLDFGGQDLPEPPLQLLHVGRLGPGQVEASSSLLPVASAQRPDHLEQQRLKLNL